MPQDPNLYGQRPAKKQKKEIPLSSSLAFSSQLSSLLSSSSSSATPTSTATSGRMRPSKAKDDLFSVKAKRKANSARDVGDGTTKLQIKDVHGTEEDKQNLARTRRKMEEKARLYNAMKRGDYVAKEGETGPLVDFDAKWAAANPEGDDGDRQSSSGADNDSDDDGGGGMPNEIIEYQDEYGRTRKGTRADIARQQRMEARRVLGAEELDAMSARPKAPENVIHGDVIQSHAFNPEDDKWDQMEALAARRDKSPTPPPDTHYDGNWEIRTKGVGFYHFSKDNKERDEAMKNLEQERENTERVRKEREAERERRKKEIEERRKKIGEKRSKRMADQFLEGLGAELAAADKTGGKEANESTETAS
ncbi:hypothetical protein PFICI_14171 [Pestalotiopsis fici W106-1]|uniref:Uncharacterized protein n=1 Tax=Pestalotiopsis fici (strain W106-1 / CGMCC3.15140) TaxID=1229662 RepID=W3WK68_PESFW|nr:uncharacterized protein PFICI_14171 [Pestalotiopsis fici W106-1]ETS74305.1 hypothetical protein PFICI_14171 [Pestalotiopsis fici W106-1]